MCTISFKLAASDVFGLLMMLQLDPIAAAQCTFPIVLSYTEYCKQAVIRQGNLPPNEDESAR